MANQRNSHSMPAGAPARRRGTTPARNRASHPRRSPRCIEPVAVRAIRGPGAARRRRPQDAAPAALTRRDVSSFLPGGAAPTCPPRAGPDSAVRRSAARSATPDRAHRKRPALERARRRSGGVPSTRDALRQPMTKVTRREQQPSRPPRTIRRAKDAHEFRVVLGDLTNSGRRCKSGGAVACRDPRRVASSIWTTLPGRGHAQNSDLAGGLRLGRSCWTDGCLCSEIPIRRIVTPLCGVWACCFRAGDR